MQHLRGFAQHRFTVCSLEVCCGYGLGGLNAWFLFGLPDTAEKWFPLIVPVPLAGLEAPAVYLHTVLRGVRPWQGCHLSTRLPGPPRQVRREARRKHPQARTIHSTSAPSPWARPSQRLDLNSRAQGYVSLLHHGTWEEINILYYFVFPFSFTEV